MGAINTFSNILPILSGLTSTAVTLERTFETLTRIGEKSGTSQQDLALRQLQEQQKLQEAQLGQQAALERERLALQASQDDESRRQSLKRAVARQRTQFGASGIGGGTGSSEAVLLGLFEESEEERQRREQLDTLRNRALDLDVTQNPSLNLLQATQLSQRQRLVGL
jgi:hypothetical protein